MNESWKKMTEKEFEAYIQKEHERKDLENIAWLTKHCVKGCTNEHLSVEDATAFYDEFVKEKKLYHYPYDAETIDVIIDTYNF